MTKIGTKSFSRDEVTVLVDILADGIVYLETLDLDDDWQEKYNALYKLQGAIWNGSWQAKEMRGRPFWKKVLGVKKKG